jgi:hypothetical protein
MSQDFQAIFDESLAIASSVPDEPTVEEALAAIHSFIRGVQNIIVDRFQFFTRRQQPGESFEHFFVALRQLCRLAEVCTHCTDTQLITLIIIGVQDSELQKKLLEIRPAPSLNQVLTVCRAFESASADQALTSSVVTFAGRKETPDAAISHPRAHQSQLRGYGNRAHKGNKCYWCSGEPHPSRNECPAKEAICKFCFIKGHYQKACKKQSKEQKSDHTGNKCVSTATDIEDHTCSGVKPVSICISTNNREVQIMAYPDTGADVNIMPESFLGRIGIHPGSLRPADITIMAYNGRRDSPIGFFPARLSIRESTLDCKIYVQRGTNRFLLSGQACEKLGIISFPLQRAQTITAAEKPNIITLTKGIEGDPTDSLIHIIRERIITDFADVFGDDDTLRPMQGPPMKIHLKPDAQPYALTAARQVAFGLREQVQQELQNMMAKGIIEKLEDEASEWCHPMVVVRKPDGRIRICVDYTKLNKFVTRSTYPTRTPKNAIDSITTGDKFFTTLDAVQGYWQMELASESQHLTTFISTEGRFRFLRAPMGLNATGDEYNRRGDIAIAGINNVQKVVDDILVHNNSFTQHVETVIAVLHRCRENGITLSKKKFTFCQPQVKYAGYFVTSSGIHADPDKVSAISQFPPPTNVTELRSFFGLVNQLGSFSHEIASTMQPLRPLLKKETAFAWADNQQTAFENVKAALTKHPILQPFDPALPTILQTDASRTRGLGFALLQQSSDKTMALVQCGSRFVSDTESRYAMVELELLAAVWAMNKCRLYLIGLPHFTLVVDHRPLIPILNSKGLDEIDNPRILRLREKIIAFSFETEWTNGKNHLIPDALSRAPVQDPDHNDQHLEADLTTEMEIRVNSMTIQLREDDYTDNSYDPALKQLTAAAKQDEQYQALIKLIEHGFPAQSALLPPQHQPYYKLRHDLTVHGDLILYQTRILIPKSQRPDVLHKLHLSHQGIDRTKRRARQTVFWPGITSDIINTVNACVKCQEGRASLPAESIESDKLPTRPFQETAVDIFQFAGYYYMIFVDRFSGWIEISKFNKSPSAEMVIAVLRRYFVQFGIPNKLRSDGGTQFTAQVTSTFMQNWGINHVFSAPHFPSSNGLAESAVKSMKALVAASTHNGDLEQDTFAQGLLELRNTPRTNGKSPAEMIFGTPLRSTVPTHHMVLSKEWQDLADLTDATLPTSTKLNLRQLKPLHPGDKCWIQDPSTKRWSSIGHIIQARQRNYTVKMPSGRILWRNRRHIRACVEGDEETTHPTTTPTGCPPIQHEETIEFNNGPTHKKNTKPQVATPYPRRSPRYIQLEP